MGDAVLQGQPSVPTLETERLILRPQRRDDLDALAALRAEFRESLAMPVDPSPVETVWRRYLATIGHWSEMGFGYWAVEETESGRFVGEVGFGVFMRPVEPGFGVTPEAGWALARWAQGRGYALEALAAGHLWMERQGVDRTVCLIDAGNERSLSLAAKLAYRQFARSHYDDGDVILMERFSD